MQWKTSLVVLFASLAIEAVVGKEAALSARTASHLPALLKRYTRSTDIGALVRAYDPPLDSHITIPDATNTAERLSPTERLMLRFLIPDALNQINFETTETNGVNIDFVDVLGNPARPSCPDPHTPPLSPFAVRNVRPGLFFHIDLNTADTFPLIDFGDGEQTTTMMTSSMEPTTLPEMIGDLLLSEQHIYSGQIAFWHPGAEQGFAATLNWYVAVDQNECDILSGDLTFPPVQGNTLPTLDEAQRDPRFTLFNIGPGPGSGG